MRIHFVGFVCMLFLVSCGEGVGLNPAKASKEWCKCGKEANFAQVATRNDELSAGAAFAEFQNCLLGGPGDIVGSEKQRDKAFELLEKECPEVFNALNAPSFKEARSPIDEFRTDI